MQEPPTNNNTISSDTEVPTRPWWQRLLAIVIIIALIAVGVVISKRLMKTSPKAKRRAPQKMQVIVKVMEAQKVSTNVTVKALGIVQSSREMSLQAQVAGTAIYLHPDLIPGGIIKKDEIVVQLDDTDYQLSLKQKKNNLAKARADLRIEEGNQNIAKQEWELIKSITGEMDTSAEDLALRAPQLAKVQMTILAAETDLEKAVIDQKRTIVKAPFDAVVRSKHVELGSQISPQSNIVTLIGIDSFWAEVSVPTSKLQWMTLPSKKNIGSKSIVYSGENAYKGNILKLLPVLEKDGLMARLLINIDDPFGLKSRTMPLLINSFIRAEISGKQINDVIKIPVSALKENNLVYLMTKDSTLHIQQVNVLWRNSESVFIDQGITPGDLIIISNLPAPIEGMPIKVAGDKSDTAIKKGALREGKK